MMTMSRTHADMSGEGGKHEGGEDEDEEVTSVSSKPKRQKPKATQLTTDQKTHDYPIHTPRPAPLRACVRASIAREPPMYHCECVRPNTPPALQVPRRFTPRRLRAATGRS